MMKYKFNFFPTKYLIPQTFKGQPIRKRVKQ